MTELLTTPFGGMWYQPGLSLKPGMVSLYPLPGELFILWFIPGFIFLLLSIFFLYKYLTLRKSISKNSNKSVIRNGKSLNFYSLIEINALLEKQQKEIQQQSEELKAQSEHLQKIIEELELLSIVASKTDNVIVIMDGKGNFEWVNDGFVKRYGMDIEEFNEKRGRNLVQSSSYPDIKNVIKKIHETGKAYNYTAKTKINDQEFVWYQTTISPVKDDIGNIIRLIAIDSDITKLKEAEKQIKNQREELSKLNSTKDKLFSIIAHDLKNPFNTIMGFTDLLLRSFDSLEKEKKKEFIRLIHESSASAYLLLEKLLDWARTQTGSISFDPRQIDISGIVNEVYQIMGMSAKSKNINLTVDGSVKNSFAFADYNMVFAVLRNLVSNALKFTNPGGSISIYSREVDDRLELSVTDTGVGMSEDEKKMLFQLEEFHSTPGTSGETGTGLGLIVCQEFIRKHGGQISVESEKGKGSTFSFSIPSIG